MRFFAFLLPALLAGCAAAGAPVLPLVPLAELPPVLSESSGLAPWGDGFVSHNDSGKAAELVLFDTTGGGLRRLPVPVPNRDWEDIARAGPHLYLADTGNNGGRRRDLRLYRLSLAEQGVTRVDTLPLRYEEQHHFAPPRHQHNFDAEALAWVEGELWLLTKRWLDQYSSLYVVPAGKDEGPLAERQRFNPRMLVTGADYDAASRTLLLVGYERRWLGRRAFVWLYPVRDGRIDESAGQRWALEWTGQFEAIALGADGHLYLTREGRGPQLFRSQAALAELLP